MDGNIGTSGWRILVGIPVHNEEALIGACLEALAMQSGGRIDLVVVLANNCTDGSAACVRAMAASSDLPVRLVETELAPEIASAGHARYLALEACVEAARSRGWADRPDRVILMTTDADGRVPHDWTRRSREAMEAGADAVCGRSGLDAVEHARIPAALHEADALECAYDDLLDRIDHRFDPDPADPMPRHTEGSGASIAVTLSAYLACGGMPPLATGEDRAFVAALRRIDAPIRHDPGIVVEVSARTEGRAAGGMAETIARRMIRPDEAIDDRLEPALDRARRALLRGELRRLPGGPHGTAIAALASRLGMPDAALARCLGAATFGARWEAVEAASPVLQRRRVLVVDLADETRSARRILGDQADSRSIRYDPVRTPAGDAPNAPLNAATNRSAAASPPIAVPVSPR